jgi:peptidoglycan/xylan/chitin deacetylase (PgdA/CDA1 family)
LYISCFGEGLRTSVGHRAAGLGNMTTRERVSYGVRIVISHALYYSGVLPLWLRLTLRRKAVVLAYHRVLTREQSTRTASQQGLVVENGTFARHVALLARRFTVLTLDQFDDHLTRRVPFPGPCCLITFDDGWIDNFENALPVLRAHKLPAVMFLPVNFIGRRRLFTREALTHLLVRAIAVCRREPDRRDVLRMHLAPFELERVLDIDDEDPLPAVQTRIGAHRYASGPAFEALAAALSSELGVAGAELSELDRFVDWRDVEQLAHGGFAFGGHGAEHRVLTQVSPEVARCEVESSKRVLDERLMDPVTSFAYPNGGWSADIAQTVKAAGYRLAFTIDPGHVSCNDDRFALQRVNIHDGMTRSTPMFMARLAGIF